MMHSKRICRYSGLAASLFFAGLLTGCGVSGLPLAPSPSSSNFAPTVFPDVPLSRYAGTWQGNWTAQMGGAQSGSVTMQFNADGHFTGQYTNTVTHTNGTFTGLLVPLSGQSALTQGYEETNTPIGTNKLTLGGMFVLNKQGTFVATFAIPPLPTNTTDADVVASATMSKQ